MLAFAARPQTPRRARDLSGWRGSPVARGIVLEGSVRVEGADVWGNASVMGSFSAGELFEKVCRPPGRATAHQCGCHEDSHAGALRRRTTSCTAVLGPALNTHRAAENLLASVKSARTCALPGRIRDCSKVNQGQLLAYLSNTIEACGGRASLTFRSRASSLLTIWELTGAPAPRIGELER